MNIEEELKKEIRNMGENKKRFEDVKEFDEAVKMIKNKERVNDLESLFLLWKRAHVLEVEEWEHDNKANIKTRDKEKQRKIPNTVPEAFLNEENVPKEDLEEAMKYSFCGDGYIGTSEGAEEPSSNEKTSSGEQNKFTRFLILKEENNIQKRTDWEKREGLKPYNTYYGDWAYDNRGGLKDDRGRATTSTAAKTAEIVRFIASKEKGKFDWKTRNKGAEESRMEEIKKVAIINLNKRGGSASADEAALVAYAERYKKFILREIELLAVEGSVQLEFVVFGKDEGEYFKEMKNMLKEKFCKIYNLPHPSRVSYKEVARRWKKSEERVLKELQ